MNCPSFRTANWKTSAFAAATSNLSCAPRSQVRGLIVKFLQAETRRAKRRVGPRAALAAPNRITQNQNELTMASRFVTSAPMRPIHVIGGGLAGSEAAWQAAEFGRSRRPA